jgi:hypothetical protein
VHLPDERERLGGGQVLEEGEILRDDADLPFHRLGEATGSSRKIASNRPRAPTAREALDRRGLTGAVGSDESVERAAGDFEVDSVDGDKCAELPAQPCV